MVAACGTGIEGCGPSVLKGIVSAADCNADPRGTWRSYVVALDKHGTVQFFRTDSFVDPTDPMKPGTIWVGTSAAEYVAVDKNGDLLITMDQGFGIGMIKASPTVFPIKARAIGEL